MFNQLIAYWVAHFSPHLNLTSPDNTEPSMTHIFFFSLGMTNNMTCLTTVLKPSQDAEQISEAEELCYFFLVIFPLVLIMLLLTARITAQCYIAIGNTITRTCNRLSTRLLHHYDLQPNAHLEASIPDYISSAELDTAIWLSITGFVAGMFCVYFPLLLSLPIGHKGDKESLVLVPAIFLAGLPSGIFGFTAGRLIHHLPNILEKKNSYAQARAILTLNDLPCNLEQHRYFPSEILGIIHSFLINSDEKNSFKIINEVMNEPKRNHCCTTQSLRHQISNVPMTFHAFYNRCKTNLQAKNKKVKPEKEQKDNAFINIELGLSNTITHRFFSESNTPNRSFMINAQEQSMRTNLVV